VQFVSQTNLAIIFDIFQIYFLCEEKFPSVWGNCLHIYCSEIIAQTLLDLEIPQLQEKFFAKRISFSI